MQHPNADTSIILLLFDFDYRPAVVRPARRARMMRAHQFAAARARRQVRQRDFPALRSPLIPFSL